VIVYHESTVPTQERYFLGVDGGQSSTRALIGDGAGRVLGEGSGGQSNHVGGAQGRARLIQAVTDALQGACTEAGLSPANVEFAAACLGFTGGADGKEPILRQIFRCRRLLITDDSTIALAGAHAAEPGIVTIAGTGSVALGRNASGRFARTGGWGYAFGDDGGAWGIVREALRASLRFQEEWGPSTALHDLFLRETGDSDIHVLRRRFYTEEYPRPRVAAFSKIVDEAAEGGDAVAAEILQGAAQDLLTITGVVRRLLFAQSEMVNVAYVGGVFRSKAVLQHFRWGLESDPHTRLVEPRYGPGMGALLEARRLWQSASE
jgi:N-acetylglucosamine kinase-like BadF-type ATPase